MKVFVIETGEYEQRYVVGVAVSVDAAVRSIKETHKQPPYSIEWSAPEKDTHGDGWTLQGDFAARAGYSTKHTAFFSMEPFDLAEGP